MKRYNLLEAAHRLQYGQVMVRVDRDGGYRGEPLELMIWECTCCGCMRTAVSWQHPGIGLVDIGLDPTEFIKFSEWIIEDREKALAKFQADNPIYYASRLKERANGKALFKEGERAEYTPSKEEAEFVFNSLRMILGDSANIELREWMSDPYRNIIERDIIVKGAKVKLPERWGLVNIYVEE